MQKLMLAIGALVTVILLAGFALPRYSTFVVSSDIDAPQATVFAQLNDLRRSALWSPYGSSNDDVSFSGPPRGVGATATWQSAAAGSGTQTIVESRPHSYVETRINAGEPGEATTRFMLEAIDGDTRVSWTFVHDHGVNVIGRYFSLMATGLIRREYENDLADLKALAESLPRADFGVLDIEHTHAAATDLVMLRTSSAPDDAAVSDALGRAFLRLLDFMAANDLQRSAPPEMIALGFDGRERVFDAAIPVASIPETLTADPGIELRQRAEQAVLKVTHTGSYSELPNTHRRIAAYLAALGIERVDNPWESFVSDPADTDEDELLTYVYYPVRELQPE